MPSRNARTAGWAGFGRFMAAGLAAAALLLPFADTSAVTPFSLGCAVAFWTLCSALYGFSAYDRARRRKP